MKNRVGHTVVYGIIEENVSFLTRKNYFLTQNRYVEVNTIVNYYT
jgi:hypothetical protein